MTGGGTPILAAVYGAMTCFYNPPDYTILVPFHAPPSEL